MDYTFSFTILYDSPCKDTVIVPSTMPSTVTVYYLNGIAEITWSDFTDTVSQTYGAGFCGAFSY